MTAETIIALLQLVTTLASNVIGGDTKTAQNLVALEAMAAAVAKAYHEEAGQPIDPLKFTYEPPLGDGVEPAHG